MSFSTTILTLFPEMFPGPLGISLIGRALEEGKWHLDTVNLREFGVTRHQNVDDTPYGGGAGMLMRPDVIGEALAEVRKQKSETRIIYMSPRGRLLNQERVRELAVEAHLTILCGRYEGVDERVLEHYAVEEVSIGDYVLAGGELAAMVLLEACVRLLPGVLGKETSTAQESFGLSDNYTGLLEYPQYTKPPSWKGLAVPEILLSGHHGQIERWRLAQAERITRQRRPDLWEKRKGNKNEPVTED